MSDLNVKTRFSRLIIYQAPTSGSRTRCRGAVRGPRRRSPMTYRRPRAQPTATLTRLGLRREPIEQGLALQVAMRGTLERFSGKHYSTGLGNLTYIRWESRRDTLAAEHASCPGCVCEDSPLCRHHHRCKQAQGWRLEQPEPGVLAAQPRRPHLHHDPHGVRPVDAGSARSGCPPVRQDAPGA